MDFIPLFICCLAGGLASAIITAVFTVTLMVKAYHNTIQKIIKEATDNTK